ncbi:unnamed protein product [Paramecium octaurelia]|uniref:Uncharacterized protein n=1 Tax=Paramecium octaurelia TaxID=43137 RepID=A0A8S1VPL0_PAROT|nr:unnamed protein product [Paramecium octaurelia]
MSFCQEPKVDCQYLKSILKNLDNRLNTLENSNQNCQQQVLDKFNQELVIPKLKLNKIQIGFSENNVPQKKVLVTFGNKENFRTDNCDHVGDKIDQATLTINQVNLQDKTVASSNQMGQSLQQPQQQDYKSNNINKQTKLKLVKQDSNLIQPIFSKKNSDQQSIGAKFYTRNNSIQSTPVKQIGYHSSLGTSPLRRKNSQKNSDLFINSLQIDDMMQGQSKFLKYFQQHYGSLKQSNNYDNTANKTRTSFKSQNARALADAQIIQM